MKIKQTFLPLYMIFLTLTLSGCLSDTQPKDVFDQESLVPDQSIRGQEFLGLLLDKKYEKLSTELAPHIDEKSKGRSLKMAFALEATSRPESWLSAYFDEWVKALPEDAAARLLRANYRMRQGIRARGTAYVSDTSESQLNEMNRLFDLSMDDLSTVKTLNDRSAYPYAIELEIAMRRGTAEQRRAIFNEGISKDPGMVWLHSTYLDTLAPKWGGSIPERNQFIQSTREKYNQFPWLRISEAWLQLDQIHAQPGEPCDKIDAFKRLNDEFSVAETAYQLGKSYSCDRQFENALPYLRASVDEWPYNGRAWRVIGAIQHALGDHDEALVSLDRSGLIDPTDPTSFFQKGQVLLYLTRYTEAVAAFEQAATINPESFRYQQYVDLAERFVEEPNKTHEIVILKTSSGPMVSETQYRSGRKEGKAVFFKNNRPFELKHYNNDVLEKVERLNENEEVVTVMSMRRDIPDGKFKEYSGKGKMISEGELSRGKAHGEIKVYFQSGEPVFSNFYDRGEAVKPTQFWIPTQNVNGVQMGAIASSGMTRLTTPVNQQNRFDFDSGQPIFVFAALHDPMKRSQHLAVEFHDAAGNLSFRHEARLPAGTAFKPGYVYYTPNPQKDTQGQWTASVFLDGVKAKDISLTVN